MALSAKTLEPLPLHSFNQLQAIPNRTQQIKRSKQSIDCILTLPSPSKHHAMRAESARIAGWTSKRCRKAPDQFLTGPPLRSDAAVGVNRGSLASKLLILRIVTNEVQHAWLAFDAVPVRPDSHPPRSGETALLLIVACATTRLERVLQQAPSGPVRYPAWPKTLADLNGSPFPDEQNSTACQAAARPFSQTDKRHQWMYTEARGLYNPFQ